MIFAMGTHRPGVVRDVTAALLDEGASVAGSRKVMLADSFAVLVSVWVPPESKTPEEMVTHINETLAPAMGFSLTAHMIDQAVAKAAQAPVKRHLKLLCPQRPGIIKAISELLKDNDCIMNEVEADTSAKGGEIWFEFECTIECPSEDVADAMKAQMEMWTGSEDKRISLVFDSATTKRYTLGGA